MLPKRPRSEERSTFLSDVLTTAIEGGINYWSQVSDYHWYSPTLDGGSAEHPQDRANAYVTIHETGDDPDDKSNIVRTIGIDDIASALRVIRENRDRPGPEWMNSDLIADIMTADRTNDASEIDAEGCDCIVQVALFGKVVYG